jgi:hypothetical protein
MKTLRQMVGDIESSDLDFEARLIALCDIDRMLTDKAYAAKVRYTGGRGLDTSFMFVWSDSDLGHEFWASLTFKVWGEE